MFKGIALTKPVLATASSAEAAAPDGFMVLFDCWLPGLWGRNHLIFFIRI